MLDIAPPLARIRDYGSMNGTFVNNKKIGQRKDGMSPEEGENIAFVDYDLKDNDKIKMGETLFLISIYNPKYCKDCNKEVPVKKLNEYERKVDIFQCDDCYEKNNNLILKKTLKKKENKCSECGKNISKGRIVHNGSVICLDCKKDVDSLIGSMINRAKDGDENLVSIKDYNLVKLIGRGGMGAVWLAFNEFKCEYVALKMMLPAVATKEKARNNFLREMMIHKQLNNHNIVKIYDGCTSSGCFFFTMEYCNGGNVRELMERRGGFLGVEEAIRIFLPILDALEYAHTTEFSIKDKKINGIVHRDLSPDNFFIEEHNNIIIPKVADFGLAKAFENAGFTGLTRTGTVAGKPLFMSRQQVIDFKYSKPEVDVWSAVASFYNMLTGKYPRDFKYDAKKDNFYETHLKLF